MKYRRLDQDSDYVFGAGPGVFLVNTPEAVAQAILTRLRLLTGEWFLDTREGTAYDPEVLGHHTQGTRDAEIQSRILGTQGVEELLTYGSSVTGQRQMSVTCTVRTIYGVAAVAGVL